MRECFLLGQSHGTSANKTSGISGSDMEIEGIDMPWLPGGPEAPCTKRCDSPRCGPQRPGRDQVAKTKLFKSRWHACKATQQSSLQKGDLIRLIRKLSKLNRQKTLKKFWTGGGRMFQHLINPVNPCRVNISIVFVAYQN